MNGITIVFVLINAIALLRLPRQWAPLPLLVGACYMTLGQTINLGPVTLSVIRILILAGFVRIILKGERPYGGMNKLDWLILLWSAAAIFSSIFHKDSMQAMIFRFGFVYNTCGIYFLLRAFCQSMEDIIVLSCIIAVVLAPVAIEMINEKLTARNFFSIFGGVGEVPAIREGKIRAQGPFAHAILAGTVGAVILPLMIGLWKQHRKIAIVGIVACLSMVFTCASSGPILSAMAGIAALFLWKYKKYTKHLCWFGIICYIGIDLLMQAPAYYLLGRIDITGGSTGWHRARLIEVAILHIDEWWLGGTDYTRHWMPTGVSWSPDHTDITNYYIKMGVLGGLPLMFLFIAMLAKGFAYVGKLSNQRNGLSNENKFIVWSLGASLFSLAATSISISFFDQSFLFFYLVLGSIGSAMNINVEKI